MAETLDIVTAIESARKIVEEVSSTPAIGDSRELSMLNLAGNIIIAREIRRLTDVIEQHVPVDVPG